MSYNKGNGTHTRCGACKFLRKKCPLDCIYAPYFPSNDPQRFETVQRIYGASNIARMLQKIPVHLREDAANSLHYEAHSRVKDPIYGCVRTIYQLQQELIEAYNHLAKTRTEIALVLTVYGQQEYFGGLEVQQENYFPIFENYCTEPNTHGFLPLDPYVVGPEA